MVFEWEGGDKFLKLFFLFLWNKRKLFLTFYHAFHRPIYVDLDVGQGQLSIPGTIGAMAIERPADVEEGFTQVCPLIYHYGHKEPGSNPLLYNMLVTKLAQAVAERMEANRLSTSLAGFFFYS